MKSEKFQNVSKGEIEMEEMTPSEGRKKGRKETNIDVNWGLDLDMSPWKSGGAVSYDGRFCLILYSFRILEKNQRLLQNMKSLVPKRGKCKKTASKKPWR